jgi:hypothetical protein
MDISGSGYSQVARFCEKGNESPYFMRGGDFLIN